MSWSRQALGRRVHRPGIGKDHGRVGRGHRFQRCLRSGPRQHLDFSQLVYGDIVFEGGSADFQVESAKALLLEKAEVGWCGGTVHFQAMRIRPSGKSYEIKLYCDRLNLAEVLDQLGVVDATGRGTVSGIIPLTIDKGTLRFGSGFLYSSPGQGCRRNVSRRR